MGSVCLTASRAHTPNAPTHFSACPRGIPTSPMETVSRLRIGGRRGKELLARASGVRTQKCSSVTVQVTELPGPLPLQPHSHSEWHLFIEATTPRHTVAKSPPASGSQRALQHLALWGPFNIWFLSRRPPELCAGEGPGHPATL